MKKEVESGNMQFCIMHLLAAGCRRSTVHADTAREPASAPQSLIATAALAWLGLAVSLRCWSSGWPAGCSPQIARGLGTSPLGSCQSESAGTRWASLCRDAENSLLFYTGGVRHRGESTRSGRRGGENYGNQRICVILWSALYVSLPMPSRGGENLTFKSTSVLYGLPWSGLRMTPACTSLMNEEPLGS